METKSTVTYWLKDADGVETEIVKYESMVPPIVGEIVNVDTRMDRDWYDANFKESKIDFFKEGIRGSFKVVKVDRWIQVLYVYFKDANIPFAKTLEEFEVIVEQVDEY